MNLLRLRYLGIALLLAVLGGCAMALPRTPVPVALVDQAHLEGYRNIRFWGDLDPDWLARTKRTNPAALRRQVIGSTMPAPSQRKLLGVLNNGKGLNFLALSGGGSDGAFGAGLLIGWSAQGTRPRFDVVTGISTGAIMAPFVFLGPDYDPQLREIYTRYTTSDILTPQILSALLGANATASSKPFARLIAKYVTWDLLDAIARAHRRGRRLLIGTSNIDAQRPVVWDMGAIANSRNKGRLALFRKIILASASIPGAFPPVRIKVRANGKTYDELHVDGGITAQVFFLPMPLIYWRGLGRRDRTVRHKLYIIRNGRVLPHFETIANKVVPLSARSLDTLIKSQANAELFELHELAEHNHMAYRLAFIPRGFHGISKEFFDRKYMQKLFETGYKLGVNGYRWHLSPP